ncbi:hypothetical protein FRC12_001215 [Ceratobasidium sp. 428]|nr:hypothetical protein FRC12_001215 [Ceratobasidium sp. 428]
MISSQIQPRTDTSFDHLPDSVISDIFVVIWCTWPAWYDVREGRIPYILAAVSRRWRAIALSTSKIWTFVDLSLRAERLATHLTRSKNLPLEVKLVLDEDSDIDVRESLRMLKETDIWARTGRLDARLSLEHVALLVDALNAATTINSRSVLQSIAIVTFVRRDRRINNTPEQSNLRIPQSQALCAIDMDCVGIFPILDPPSSPLLGLQRLVLERVEVTIPDSLLPFLELTPNLEKLILRHCYIGSTPNTATAARPRHSIVLANLWLLSLYDVEGVAGLNLLFRTLNMPNLGHLSFRTDSNCRWTRLDWEAICHCRALKDLSLQGFSSRALAGLLSRVELLNRLKSIDIRNTLLAIPDEFAVQLVHRLLVDVSCCPNLSALFVLFPLQSEHIGTVKELRRTRPTLIAHVDWDESQYEEADAVTED